MSLSLGNDPKNNAFDSDIRRKSPSNEMRFRIRRETREISIIFMSEPSKFFFACLVPNLNRVEKRCNALFILINYFWRNARVGWCGDVFSCFYFRSVVLSLAFFFRMTTFRVLKKMKPRIPMFAFLFLFALLKGPAVRRGI